MKHFVHEIIDQESSAAILKGLQNFPGSEPYMDILKNLAVGTIDYKKISACLE
jgi:hypothetical protein